jgi:hypothetical protein
LRILFARRHPAFLCHIRWKFVSRATIATLFKDSWLCCRTELLWLAVFDRSAHRPGLDSLIISEFPPLFDEFGTK